MDVHHPERDITPEFVAHVAEWITNSGEVLVVLRYLRAAGAKDFALCRTTPDFELLLKNAPIGTDIVVFRDPQLPIRGVINEAFASRILESIHDGEEYLIVTISTGQGTVLCENYRLGDQHADLREVMNDLRGKQVAIGRCPAFWHSDSDTLISASKGGIDGPR